jgi:hypothetical protein
MSDAALAKKLGVGRTVVTARRCREQVAAFQTQRLTWSRKALALLGTMSDRELASKLGCSGETVRCKRRDLGIPAYQPHQPQRS